MSSVAAVRQCSVLSPLGSSDHCCVLLQLLLAPCKSTQSARRWVWLYKKADFDSINEALDASLPVLIEDNDSDNADSARDSFKEVFMTVMKEHIPRCCVNGRKNLPWITKSVRCFMLRCDEAHRQAKRKDCPAKWRRYRSLWNKAVSVLREAKKAFFKSLSGKVNQLKDFWKVYHSISKDHQCVPSTLLNGFSSASISVAKATMLNEQFASTFTPREDIVALLPSVPEGVPRFSSIQCTSENVLQVLGSMRQDVATDPDGLSSVMLRGTVHTTCTHLSQIFNTSLRTGKVPTDWKQSNITPIFKSGDASQASNYRPKSLLSLVSKVLERLVHNAIMSHVLDNGLLSDPIWLQTWSINSGGYPKCGAWLA